MKAKKLLASACALALTLGMTAPAMATDTVVAQGATGTEITIGSTLHVPTIKVTVGTTTDVIVNPYKMEFEAGKTDSLYSAPTTIKSNSTVSMDVTATPTGSGNGVTFMETAVPTGANRPASPAVHMVLKMDNATDKTTAEAYDGTAGQEALIVKDDNSNSPKSATITMPAATDNTDTNAKWAAFIITGDTGGDGWDQTTNAITVKVIFTIKPVIGA